MRAQYAHSPHLAAKVFDVAAQHEDGTVDLAENGIVRIAGCPVSKEPKLGHAFLIGDDDKPVGKGPAKPVGKENEELAVARQYIQELEAARDRLAKRVKELEVPAPKDGKSKPEPVGKAVAPVVPDDKASADPLEQAAKAVAGGV